MSRNRTTKFNERPVQDIVIRQTQYYPSVDMGGCNTSSKPSQKYTGTYIIGIATMHKSNAIPVTSDSDAKDIARMRRG